MTDKSITQYTSRELLVQDNKTQIENIGRKLMRLAVGGRHLTPDQATELAVASLITGANPFNGEIYNGDVGIMLGIPYYLRRANEQIHFEIGRPGSVQADYKPASHEDAQFDETKGDLAWTVTITDDATEEINRKRKQELFRMFKVEGGMDAKTAWTLARDEIGPVKTWSASAVVYVSEKFEKEGKDPKWDRNERCKKRALKAALKKRFTGIEFAGNGEDQIILDADVREVVHNLAQNIAEPPREEKVVINELGYDAEPEPAEPASQIIIDADEKEQPQYTQRSPIVQAMIDGGYAQDNFDAAGILNKMPQELRPDKEKAVAWARLYRGWRDLDTTPDKAAEMATSGKSPDAKQEKMF